jgi:dTDP-4-dehydrorhamnose reductase
MTGQDSIIMARRTMRAIVTGASGFIGRAILAKLGPDRAVGTYHTKPAAGLVYFDTLQHSFADLRGLVNGDVSHVFVTHGAVNPELCARDPVRTAKVNVESIIRLLSSITAEGMTPVFLSTDYVFDGSRSLSREDETLAPNTEYGRQKSVLEQWLQSQRKPWLIARLSKVVSADRRTHSVLGQWANDICEGKTMRSATDQIFSPAHVEDAAGAMIRLAEQGFTGIFHVAGPDAISRYDLNKLLLDCIQSVNPAVVANLEPCRLSDIAFIERRPLDTSLCVKKLQQAINWPFRSMMQICREIAEAEFKDQSGHSGRCN